MKIFIDHVDNRFRAFGEHEDPDEGGVGMSPDEALGNYVRERLLSDESLRITDIESLEAPEDTVSKRVHIVSNEGQIDGGGGGGTYVWLLAVLDAIQKKHALH